MNKEINDIRLYSTSDIAKIFNVSMLTVYRWIKGGQLPKPITFTNNRKYFPKKEVDALIFDGERAR